MTEEYKTLAVKNCKSFIELEKVLRSCEPFVSYSRNLPVEYFADDIIRRIFAVIDGGPLTNITRANGLRYKVEELVINSIKLR